MPIALIDCDAFFCNCERLFRPDLKNVPIGVLSNNDGCFVSRTKELKALGVKMGEPYFKVKSLCDKNKVAVFSSNFSLYTNISDRVMHTLSQFTPILEIYSVDEAFLSLEGFENRNLLEYGREIKRTVERNVGIPVSIGIGPTKVLAKVATRIAKKFNVNGVYNVCDPKIRDWALERVDVSDLWGIGSASSNKLYNLNIRTAKDFRDYKNPYLIKKLLTKVGLQIKEELEGKVRFSVNLEEDKKKEIMCSRTFGSSVNDIESLRQAIASYVSRAAYKLRKQGSTCSSVEIFMRTNPHNNSNQYYAFEISNMLSMTSDTRKIIRYSMFALDKIFKAGYEYKKVGARLTGINDKEHTQLSFLDQPDDIKSESLMSAMDLINNKDGPDTVRIATCGTDNKSWRMNRNLKSKRFVSGWSELPTAK